MFRSCLRRDTEGRLTLINIEYMFEQIVRFSIQKKLCVALTTLFLLAGGIYSMLTLPIDAVPDITKNQVHIVTV